MNQLNFTKPNTRKTGFDIARDCTLVAVEGSLYPWSKRDEVAAHNAAAAESAVSERFSAHVQRLVKEDRLPVQQKLSEARRFLDFPTGFRWDGKGNFAVLNTKLDSVKTKLETYRAEFYAAVDALCHALPALRDKARTELNGAFDRLGFPTEDEVRERYRFEIRLGVIPHADDIRLNHVSGRAQAAIESAVRKEAEEKITELHQTVVTSLESALARVVSNLSDFSEGKIARFEDTLVTNLEELVEALPQLNVTGDRTISSAIVRSRDLLSSLHKAAESKTLRAKEDEGKEARKVIATEAKDILSKLKSGAVKAKI
jgi:hypothetical protein